MSHKKIIGCAIIACLIALATPIFAAQDAKYDVAALIEPKLATPLLDIERAQVSGTNIVIGSTPVSGVCTNGFNLYNNNGVVGCQANTGGGGTPGGTSGQIQYNNASAFGGFTMSGDCTLVTSTGVISCAALGGKAVTLGGPLTTTGAGTTTLAFAAAGVTYTFPTGAATLLATNGNGSALTGFTYSQLPSLSANQVLGALTATTPSGQSVPSCSSASNALIWTSGTGFGCNTFSGATHATNIVTFSPLAKAGTAAVYGVGSGYVTNDTITMATTGGTCSTAPVLTVTASAGAITALAVTTAGSCTVLPANNPATQGTTSGSGINGTFVITWTALAQTYTPTAGVVAVDAWALGAGASGGSGSAETASVASSGGGGGGAGALTTGHFTAAQIGGSQTITIGIGGIPVAPPVATSAAAGANGKVGGNTTIGSLFVAWGGGGGSGGNLAAVGSGGGGSGGGGSAGVGVTSSATGGAGGFFGGAAGGSAVGGGAPANLWAGSGGAGCSTAGVAAAGGTGYEAAGGGSGGGLSSISGTNSGGNGGSSNVTGGGGISGGSGSAANTNGNPGTNPSAFYAQYLAGSGGGGGGSGATQTTAGNGGAGGNGAGGGGGGSVVVGTTSVGGWGGPGGSGGVTIIEYF